MEVIRLTANQFPDDISHHLNRLSLFCSSGFLSLWEKIGGGSVFWVVCDPDQDNKIIALLPGLEFGSTFFKRFQAMADGCYGRIIPLVEKIDMHQAANMTLNRIGTAGYLKIYINDFYGCFQSHFQYEGNKCSTRIIDITKPGWMPPDNSLKRAIIKAQRESLVVRRFQKEDLEPFLSLVDKTVKRQSGKTIRYPADFYKGLADLASKDARIIWKIVYDSSTPVASHIYLHESDMLLYWAGFFDINYSHLKANQQMMYMTAKEFAAKGISYLNLGSSPGNTDSLDNYKRKWGGKIKTYNTLVRKSWLGSLL